MWFAEPFHFVVNAFPADAERRLRERSHWLRGRTSRSLHRLRGRVGEGRFSLDVCFVLSDIGRVVIEGTLTPHWGPTLVEGRLRPSRWALILNACITLLAVIVPIDAVLRSGVGLGEAVSVMGMLLLFPALTSFRYVRNKRQAVSLLKDAFQPLGE